MLKDAINSLPKGIQGLPFRDMINDSDGIIFIGIVETVRPVNQSITVKYGDGKLSGRYVFNIFSSMFGLTSNYTPHIGEKVLCLRDTAKNNLCYILGVLPNGKNAPNAIVTNYIDPVSDTNFEGVKAENREKISSDTESINSSTMPLDLIDGEVSLQNAQGVGVDFLSNLVKLKASDLAYIAAFVQDDFVRIMSINYEHLHSAGETKICTNGGFNDIMTNIARGFSGAKLEKEGKDNVKSDMGIDANYYEDSAWVFTQFVGKLGGVISGWIKEPATTLRSKDDKTFKSGRFRYTIAADGSVIMQSMGAIIIERTTRIPVPQLNEKRIDEEFNTASRELKSYKEWLPSGGIYDSVWMIRDYVKYMSNYYTLAEFRAQKDRIIIPNETELEDPSYANSSEGSSVNQGQYSKVWDESYIYSNSRFVMFKDGCIEIDDVWGNNISMTNLGMKVSSTLDIELHAAKDINIMAGRDINMLARSNIEISAIMRGVLIKATRWFEALCLKGPMLLESKFAKGDLNEDPKKYAGLNTDKDTEYQDRVQRSRGNAMSIIATYSNLHLKAKYNIQMFADRIIQKAYDIFISLKHVLGINDWLKLTISKLKLSTQILDTDAYIEADNIIVRRKPINPVSGPKEEWSLIQAKENENFDRSELEQQFTEIEEETLNETQATFKYRSEDLVKNRVLTQNMAQQVIMDSFYDSKNRPPYVRDDEPWERETLKSNGMYGSKDIGYPYPEGSGGMKQKFYKSTIKTLSKPSNTSAEKLTSGKMRSKKSFTWFFWKTPLDKKSK